MKRMVASGGQRTSGRASVGDGDVVWTVDSFSLWKVVVIHVRYSQLRRVAPRKRKLGDCWGTAGGLLGGLLGAVAVVC